MPRYAARWTPINRPIVRRISNVLRSVGNRVRCCPVSWHQDRQAGQQGTCQSAQSGTIGSSGYPLLYRGAAQAARLHDKRGISRAEVQTCSAFFVPVYPRRRLRRPPVAPSSAPPPPVLKVALGKVTIEFRIGNGSTEFGMALAFTKCS